MSSSRRIVFTEEQLDHLLVMANNYRGDMGILFATARMIGESRLIEDVENTTGYEALDRKIEAIKQLLIDHALNEKGHKMIVHHTEADNG